MFQAQCDAQMDTLTSEQASRLVSQLGLGQIYTVLQGNPQKPLSSQTPVMDALNISSFVVSLPRVSYFLIILQPLKYIFLFLFS